MFQCPEAATLVWDGDDLVDVTSGMRIHEDGSISKRTLVGAYPFDRAIGFRDGDTFWSIAYANRHTKAILLKDGRVHRELNRSYYFAHVYDYPIALARGPLGNILLIHCPEDFDTLEIEDAETGTKFARKKIPEMEFHSRLAVSSNSKYLLDAGWFWHPVGGAWLCEIDELLRANNENPQGHSFSFGAEIDSVAFRDESHVLITSTDEVINEKIPPGALGPRQLGLWSISTSSWCSRADLCDPAGTIMPWRDWIVSFYEYPKVIEISTGRIIHSWDKIYSGKQLGSIDLGDPPPPLIAIDPQRGRFAVQIPDGVAVACLS